GIVWFRRIFELPASWQGGDVELRLSAIDDFDTTWVNGTWVGATEQWNAPRRYRVPAAALRRTGNVVAVRVLDTGGNGGIWDPELPLQVRSLTNEFDPVSLAGPWSVNFAATFAAIPRPPASVAQSAGAPTVLYNGMIAPLVPYAMRGVAFYQGEANADRAQQYRKLFPALIADWRRQWGVDDFPFLFVQIAPFREQPPEIREAQLLAWQSTRRTAMVVTIDVGDANDIHPAQKAPVGARLALAARALAYGENLEFSGPVWKDLRIDGAEAVVTFGHLGGGLVAPGGTLRGFTIAGVDRVFHPAEARIAGDTVVVTSSAVAQPVAVRYGWQNVASGNLFNRVGLPASPFRTDVD
ncbi:MAG TPA: sialate O-acetylesterase, partial [Candidatus Synoicihabitans sp.]|nr:sialate O-acetylesterase [Candidatus Synoicihabitans sp.]